MPRRSDIWRIGIVAAPIEALTGGLAAAPVRWLPAGAPFTFLADPFGLEHGGTLHIFTEAYDYRTRHGVIDVVTLAADGNLSEPRTALREPWHLSYPFLFEAEGEAWMAPEAHRSGALTLYHAAASGPLGSGRSAGARRAGD